VSVSTSCLLRLAAKAFLQRLSRKVMNPISRLRGLGGVMCAQRIEHLPEMSAHAAAEGVVDQRQTLGLVLELGQPLDW
jgi:hypothetical protein